MYYLLFFLLAVLVVAIYIIDGDIISPAMIMCAVWLICSFIAYCFKTQWGIGISFQTIVVVIAALSAFIIGQLVASKWYRKRRQGLHLTIQVQLSLRMNQKVNFLIQLFMIVVVLLIFIYELNYSKRMGNTQGVSLMLKYVRSSGGEAYPQWLNFCARISAAMGTFYVYILCTTWVKREKLVPQFLLGVIIHFAQGMLSGGRTWLIYLLVELFIYTIVTYKNVHGWKRTKNIKLILICSGAFCVFLYMFPRLGLLIGKGVNRNPWEMVGYYAGSSIPLFSNWLESWKGFSLNTYFGEHTLYGVYNFLNLLGMNFPISEIPLETTYIPHFYSNIYTSLRRYIQDYGYVGMLLFQALWGLIYGYIYEKIKRTKNTRCLLLFYGAYFYPIAEHAIEERILCKIFTVGSFFQMIVLWGMYKVFIIEKREKINENEKCSI